ncbi:MAG: hypothetical protein ABIF77_07645 [bacterium]
MRITQYCSVCREELAMEVVNTGDGEEDGVTWLQCPHCEGFLPKIDEGPADTETPQPSGTAVDNDAAPNGFGADTELLDTEDQPVQDPEPSPHQQAEMEQQQLGEVTEQSDVLETPQSPGSSPSGESAGEPSGERTGEPWSMVPVVGNQTVDTQAVVFTDDLESSAVSGDSVPDSPLDPISKSIAKSHESAETEDLTAYQAQLVAADVSLALPYRPWDSFEVGDVIHHLAWDDCGIVVAKEFLPGKRSVVKVFFERTGIVRLIEQAAREP